MLPVIEATEHDRGNVRPGAVPAPRSLPVGDLVERFSSRDYSVSIAEPGDYAEVEALSRAADPKELFAPATAESLAWFTDANPHGPGFVVIARSARDRSIAGHFLFYATTLVERRSGIRTIAPAYLYVHLYVSPAHRRSGVFGTMFAFGLEVLNRMGIRFAYTVPNPRSSVGFAKFGVPLLGTLPCWMAPSSETWRRVSSLASWGRARLDVERVGAFDAAMIPPEPEEPRVRGLRTFEALTWRFGRRPGTEYGIWRVSGEGRAAGYVVTRVLTIKGYRVLAVCDIGLDRFDAPAIRAAIGGTCRQTASDRAALVMLQGGPPDRAGRRALWCAGFVHVPDFFLPQPVTVFGGDPRQPGSTGGLPLLDGWQLTPGDWDVF